MADTIKGVTVKIGADTTDFVKELKKVDKEINTTARTATELQKGLELEFDSSRFAQAQKTAQKALETTEAKAEAIRKQLQYLEDTGGVDTDGYVKLEQELAKTETRALKLKEQLDDIDKIKLENVTKGFTDLSNKLNTAAQKTAALSLAAVGAIAGIYKMGSDAAFAGAEIQDMADRLGIAAEEIQRYDYIALQSGLETEELVKSIAKARDAIGTGLAGSTSTASKSLEALFGNLSNIPTNTEDAFFAIVEELGKVEDSTMQAYYANEIFGERLATNLIPLLNTGADRFEKLNEEFEAIGYLSNEQVQSLADFDDELNIMRERMELARIELGIALIPIMEIFVRILEENVIPAVKKITAWFEGLSEPMQNIIVGGLALVAALSPVLFIMSKLIGVVPSLIKLLGSLKTASLATAAGFAAIAGALGLSLNLIGNWSQMSVLEKILYGLGIAALTAAAAVTVFHASWSLGIAIGAIAAGIVAGIAAINAAASDIGIDYTASSSGIPSDSGYSGINTDYSVPTGTTGTGNSYSEDNSSYTININGFDSSGNENYDAKALADLVIKEIQVQKQARGV